MVCSPPSHPLLSLPLFPLSSLFFFPCPLFHPFILLPHSTERKTELLDLATLPKFKRRGAGAQLVNWGLERADREEKRAVLSASPQGLSLYRKLGFVERDELRIDLGEYGGEGVHVHGELSSFLVEGRV